MRLWWNQSQNIGGKIEACGFQAAEAGYTRRTFDAKSADTESERADDDRLKQESGPSGI